ncbi:DUF4174 domain-containing protein [Paracoccus sediminis]|uniref:DUF4174 domain-containing protein n=1 Tax=Paracoccus sediminis TaxID=1214787 RepID=A0A238XPS7_9RHOB|nr:DUF4174 domain-containing protein [Paracoccus sediminis]TBN48192.1 DUF4174 domain-containing protein [Paracoccus sediminis]SNR60453.1 protein of unknown function [Paracoccus sediminis]
MKLKLLIAAMLTAAMGPAREAPPPEIPSQTEARPVSPEELAPPQPQPARPELRILSATDTRPEDFLWNARPVVVFADTPDDPAFREQLRALAGRNGALVERDVVVITDSDPQSRSPWRQELHPRGFSLVIIDKDGQVKQRRPLPWDVREISRAIDKLPLRRQEIGRAGLLP